ncbi:MAG: roadblock/LC7 domain-containing protein [Fibrobacter sp.]|jgi:predicted regulator of Ras-like GTPase activity (Roadblock/LC7/MglB family)|nr:roadblock/LC7 domain-containing protein [Fibrobacter sp.]
MKDMILFPEDIDHLNTVLSQLVTKANLLLAVLINKDGRLLTNQGSLELVDTVSLAALVAGNSASTLAIANLVGETEFSTMYHQGRDKHIYIAVVDDNTFLALIFDDRTNIDRVKVFARQFDRQLKAALVQVYNKTEDQVDLDLGMNQFDAVDYDSTQQPPGPPQNFQNSVNYFPGQPEQPSSIDPAPFFAPPGYPQGPEVTPTSVNGRRAQEDSDIYYLEPNKNAQKPINPTDTNYLYLKNKIKETVKRKKED